MQKIKRRNIPLGFCLSFDLGILNRDMLKLTKNKRETLSSPCIQKSIISFFSKINQHWHTASQRWHSSNAILVGLKFLLYFGISITLVLLESVMEHSVKGTSVEGRYI